MDQVKFVKDHIILNFLKGCLPQILLGPFLNTLSQNVIFLTLVDQNLNVVNTENFQGSTLTATSVMMNVFQIFVKKKLVKN